MSSSLRIYTYALVVDDLDDGSNLAGVRTAPDQHNAANLHELPWRLCDIDRGHCEGFLGAKTTLSVRCLNRKEYHENNSQGARSRSTDVAGRKCGGELSDCRCRCCCIANFGIRLLPTKPSSLKRPLAD